MPSDNKPQNQMLRSISKRRFLTVVAGSTALSLAARQDQLVAAELKNWDVIIVGGGTAGLPAAIYSAKRGARVLIVEAAGTVGGSLFHSGATMSAAGTKLQKLMGIEDSPQLHFEDVMRISRGTANPEIVKLAVFNAAETFNWLTDNGLKVRPNDPIIGSPNHDPYSARRYAAGIEGGLSVLAILEKLMQPHVDAGRITVLTSTEAKSLIQDDEGRVVGVEVSDVNGTTSRHIAPNVALTAGGFSANPKMVLELDGVVDYADNSYPYSQGAGITLGLQAGGFVTGQGTHTPLFGSILADDDYPAPSVGSVRHWVPDRRPWEIYVNVRGERFYREDIENFDAQEQALAKQPNQRCWVVFDERIFREAPKLIAGNRWSQEDIRAAFTDGLPMFYKANSLTLLARSAGINEYGLEKTVRRFNEAQRRGSGDEFRRQHMPRPITEAPFYAIRTQGVTLITYAGLAVDKNLHVIRKDGTPIRGLYAAGELIGSSQTMGQSYCAGMAVTPALTFGRLLGQKIFQLEA